MTCYNQQALYRPHDGSKPTLKKPANKTSELVMIRCNRCLGCKLDYETEWSVRMMHEASMSEAAYFVTLTYDEDNLPPGNSLRHKDWQKFIKTLRNKYPKNRIRFFQCGEYGEENSRPHFHAALYGLPLDDLEPSPHGRGQHAKDYSQSNIIDEAWQKGIAVVAPLTLKTAGYMARYMLKTATIEGSKNNYNWIAPDGSDYQRMPPYATMSTKPGIGFKWFQKFGLTDIYESGDFVRLDYKNYPPPRYYDRLLKKQHPELYEEIKAQREKDGRQLKALHERSRARMETKQEVKRIRLTRYKASA